MDAKDEIYTFAKQVNSDLHRLFKMNTTMKNLQEMVNNAYGKDYLLLKIEEWIKFIALRTEPENLSGSENQTRSDAYLDLLNFLFSLKEALEAE